MKQIKYYRKAEYGTVREYIHPSCKGDAAIIRQLTGQKTITSVVRELVRDLSNGLISWEEVIAP
jgi:hypothetical protein